MAKGDKKKLKWPDRAINQLTQREGKFWGSVLVPFVVCFNHKIEFFLWIMFVFVAGQLGTIINIVNRTLFHDWTISQALYPDSVSGSFYTYALVLIASLIVPLFTRIRNNKEPGFRSMSVVLMTLLIFALVLSAVFFSFASQEIRSVKYDDFKNIDLNIDWKQTIFFVIAVIFAWYAFGLSLMADNNEGNELDDKYLKQEQEDVDDMEEKSAEIITDGKDTAL